MADGSGKLSGPPCGLYLFLEKWFDASPVITVHTSGSTGAPKELVVRKDRMMQSARLTCEFLNLQAGDTALLCMNLRYIGAMMVVVRSLVAGLNLIVRPASGHPLSDIEEPLRFAAMVPLQVYNTLRVPEEKARLEQTDILIIGGGAVERQSGGGNKRSSHGGLFYVRHDGNVVPYRIAPSERRYRFQALLSFSLGRTVLIR